MVQKHEKHPIPLHTEVNLALETTPVVRVVCYRILQTKENQWVDTGNEGVWGVCVFFERALFKHIYLSARDRNLKVHQDDSGKILKTANFGTKFS